MRLDLKNITAVCLQGRGSDWGEYRNMMRYVKKSLTYMVKHFNFHEIIFISCEDPQIKGVRFVHTEPLSYFDYNKWCLHSLSDYVNTDFGLLFQDDGFPLNPEMWRDEFMEYDYVGAPIKLPANIPYKEELIGGGGFTLRSKKLMEFTKTIQYPDQYGFYPNEDTTIVVTYRDEMLEKGLRICPHNIARHFVIQNAIDSEHTLFNTFGYHGRDEKLDIVDKIMDDRLEKK
jgi:hypothetical protein